MSVPNLLPAAEQELIEAIDWYEGRTPGLGVEFLGVVDLALRAIGDGPERYPAWQANPRFRRHVLDRFPSIVFFHLPEVGPGYWLHRVGP